MLVSGSKHITLCIEASEAAGTIERDEDSVREMIRQALDTLGLHSQKPLEIEAFSGNDGGALVFVTLNDETGRSGIYYRFDDADDMLDCYNDAPSGAVMHQSNGYFWLLRTQEDTW